MDIILEDATAEVRRWYDKWFKDNFKYLSVSFSAEECVAIAKLSDAISITARFAIVIEGYQNNIVFKKLKYGTRHTPKVPIDVLLNSYLEEIYPKYREVVEGYVFANLL